MGQRCWLAASAQETRRSAAYKTWADATLGFMGRCPDYLNAVLTAYYVSADLLKEGADNDKYAVAFAIPTNTKGLHFISRESMSLDDSSFDHPLSSRLEEMY